MIIYASLVKPMYRGSWFSFFISPPPRRSYGSVAPLEENKIPIFSFVFPSLDVFAHAPFRQKCPRSIIAPYSSAFEPLLRLALAFLVWFCCIYYRASSLPLSFIFSWCSWNLSRGVASVLCLLVLDLMSIVFDDYDWAGDNMCLRWWMDGLQQWSYWVSNPRWLPVDPLFP